MSRPVLIATGRPPEEALEALERVFDVRRLWEAPSLDALLADGAGEAEAIASFGKRPVDADLLERLPRIRIVSHFGVGYDSVDAAFAARRGIVVTNTPDVLNEEVADTALGLLITTVREFAAAERWLREGRWSGEGPYRLTSSLRGRTVGVIGMGRIGRAIARRLDAFDLPVVYHSRRPQPDLAYRHYPDLVAMAREVDTLIAILPGGAETKGVINAEVFRALGPDGVLINVARGSVVDEPALIAALRDGVILAAGLDVFAQEPHVPEELIALPNAVLLPHVGSASVATRRAMADLVVANLEAYAAGEPPLTPVAETPFKGWGL
ncbi:2-hydroxyacid dehydrogenase [Methylopila turkensis]|uniref:Glycerate dehydrogenase n=1 Tax=Methylopila turkensis TaxID=1437816 RepID=A0A9W6JMD8_9HYPH|nr:2-hydroxyacid dehydrogenase [Methylopila turkensis]GLK78903.1 glycerate dehydrogenase [Methylopila turkensis]